MADFSDLGGVPVGKEVSQENSSLDFSDLGGKPVQEDEGAIIAAGRGALRNFPFAQQAAAAVAPFNPFSEKSTYGAELEHLTQAAEASKAAHPVAYGAGAVAGTAAPMAIPAIGEALGMAGPALEAAGGAGIAGGAINGATQGISDTNVVEHPGQAAGQAALGAGIGGLTAGVIGNVMGNAPGAMEGAANRSAVKSAMLNRNYLGHLDADEVNDLGEFMTEHGLVNRNTQDALEQAEIIKSAYGNAIQQIGADAQELDNPKTYIKALASKAARYEDRADPEFIKMGKTYNYAIQELKGLGKHPTFAQLQELKTVYGDHAFNADHTVANKAAADVYFTLKDAMSKIVNDSPGEYAGVLKGYANTTEVLNGLTKKLGTERAGSQGIGMGSIGRVVRQMPGPLRAAAGTAAAVAGHPYIAGMAALPEIMNPALHSQALTGLSKAAPKLGQAAQLELANALESKFKKEVQ